MSVTADASKSQASSGGDAGASADKKDVTCYGCNKKGHYKNECKSKHLWDKEAAVRKVGASGSQGKSKKGSEKTEEASSSVKRIRKSSL